MEKSINDINKIIFESNIRCCNISNEIIKKDIKKTIKDKLKDCDKEVLINIVVELCNMYIETNIFSNMRGPNSIQQYVNKIQTNVQEVDNFITQRINANFKNK